MMEDVLVYGSAIVECSTQTALHAFERKLRKRSIIFCFVGSYHSTPLRNT